MCECTILIPTHNRHSYLDRCVSWFCGHGYNVVIADSSEQEWSSAYRDNPLVTYVWDQGPGFPTYISKIKKGLDYVCTPYVNICADDDFLLSSGINKCVSFLNHNPDYSFAQGYIYAFQSFDRRIVLWPMPYKFISARQCCWITRIEQYSDTVYYGVNRTYVLKAAFVFLFNQNTSEFSNCAAGFFDLAITAITAKMGKICHVPVPFGMREYSPIVSAVGQRHKTICNPSIFLFYRNLIEFICEGRQCDERDRMQKFCAKHYSDCIAYDASVMEQPSRKLLLWFVRGNAIIWAEELYRRISSLRLFMTCRYLPLLSVYLKGDFWRFLAFIKGCSIVNTTSRIR